MIKMIYLSAYDTILRINITQNNCGVDKGYCILHSCLNLEKYAQDIIDFPSPMEQPQWQFWVVLKHCLPKDDYLSEGNEFLFWLSGEKQVHTGILFHALHTEQWN